MTTKIHQSENPPGKKRSAMNVANLQLEGWMMAIASINNVLVHSACYRLTTSTLR